MKVRLHKFLADCGIASRRQSETMILGGRVRVNGQTPTTLPVIIDPDTDVVTIDNQEVALPQDHVPLAQQAKVYYLLNKPKGILVTSHDPAKRKTVHELMTGVKERLFPVGRLDMDARGALIMTNDGELTNRLTHPRFGIEKTYIAEVDGKLEHHDVEKLKRGVWLAGSKHAGAPVTAQKTERLRVSILGRERGRTILEIKTNEGAAKAQSGPGRDQLRRTFARIGHTLRDLNRVAIGGKVTIKNMEPGEFRPLTEAEIKWLYRASSPEFHSREQAATQAWYEAKEMEKERKRLARGETPEAQVEKEIEKEVEPTTETPKSKVRKLRPQHKGKKPFIPPTGRNAGVPMGGNARGRRRMDTTNAEYPRGPADVGHPLGDGAFPDEE